MDDRAHDGPGDGQGDDGQGDDGPELAAYVEIWWQAVGDLVALLESLPDDAWGVPTDLPGWDVRACAAHTAHLESVLSGGPDETADIGRPAHVTGLMGAYTEIGVVNRRDTAPTAIVAELREVTARRHDALLADPPTDGATLPAVGFPGVPWPWRTLLRNRPLDVWMHEQDVRRAVGRGGHLDTPAARHTAGYLAEGLGYVLAKRAAASPGSTLLLDLAGSDPYAFAVGADGRGARLAAPPAHPTVTLRLDREAFVRLAGGRGAVEPERVVVEGDAELAQRILTQMATTP